MIASKHKETALFRYIKLPIRILSLAKDIYVKSLTGSGPNLTYGNAMGCPTPQMPAIMRSLSTNPQSSPQRFRTVDEDLPELIRSSSIKKTSGELQRWRSMPAGKAAGSTRPRSNGSPLALVFGRIDEESELVVDGEEEEEDGVGLLRPDRVYARSKSYAVVVSKRSKVMG